VSPLPRAWGGGTACDPFAQALVLRADRELGRAESEALDRHLDDCGRCQREARRLEALASILKRWDAETVAPVAPPQRIRTAVLSEVSGEMRRRRSEVRFHRVLRLATAACVVLVIGASAWLGAGSRAGGLTPGVDAAPVAVTSAAGPAGLHGRAASGAADRVAPERLDLAFTPPEPFPALPARPPLGVSPDVREVASLAVLPHAVEEARERRFARAFGEPGVWWRADVPGVPGSESGYGEAMLLTAGAAEWLRSSGLLLRLSVKSTGFVYAKPASRGALTGDGAALHVAEPLGLPRDRAELDGLLDRLAYAAVRPVEVAALPPRPVPGVVATLGGNVMDASEAVRARVLVFHADEDGHEVVYAMVRGNVAPVFLPAGELLVGGRRDLVLAEPTWIPPHPGSRETYRIRAVPVSTTTSRFRGGLRPAGLLAGPSVRALLARGAPTTEVMARVRDLCVALNGRSVDLSLLDAFLSPHAARSLPSTLVFETALEGIVVRDLQGRFLGMERSVLSETEAPALLGRLLVGYAVEAAARQDAPSDTGPSARATALLGDLVTGNVPLEPVSDAEGAARFLRLVDDARSGLVVTSVEVDGKPVHASALRAN
jgi:hypothetical protein